MYRSEIDFHEPTQMFLGYDRVDEGVTEGTLRISHCLGEQILQGESGSPWLLGYCSS